MRSRPLLAATAAALVALTTTACAHPGTADAASPGSTPSAASTVGTEPPVPTIPAGSVPAGTDDDTDAGASLDLYAGPDTCQISQSGANVRLRVTNLDAAACADMARTLSGNGAFWTVRSQPGDTSQHQLVCAMTKDDHGAAVLDTGGAIIGQALCANLLQGGWQEDTAAEDAHARARAAASVAAAQTQQDAQAQAAEADQLSRDSDAVDTALAHVQGWPATLTEDLGKVDAALKDVKTALAQTRTDAAGGQGEDCYNVTTVSYDAEQNVGYAVTQGVGYAATQDVGADITSARDDIDTLEQAVAALTAHAGAQAPAGVDAARAALRRAIAAAVSHTNTVIDQANAHAKTAYGIAKKLATGACDGDGPGDRESVARIR